MIGSRRLSRLLYISTFFSSVSLVAQFSEKEVQYFWIEFGCCCCSEATTQRYEKAKWYDEKTVKTGLERWLMAVCMAGMSDGRRRRLLCTFVGGWSTFAVRGKTGGCLFSTLSAPYNIMSCRCIIFMMLEEWLKIHTNVHKKQDEKWEAYMMEYTFILLMQGSSSIIFVVVVVPRPFFACIISPCFMFG